MGMDTRDNNNRNNNNGSSSNNSNPVTSTASSASSGVSGGDEDDEEYFDPEPLPILGRCKALYPFEGEFGLLIKSMTFDLNRLLHDMSGDIIYHSITQMLSERIEKIFKYDILRDRERFYWKSSFYHYHFASGKTL